MKKTLLIIAAAVIGLAGNAQTQSQRDCNKIVEAYFATTGHDPETYPEDKFEYRCQWSANAFYFADAVPSTATVFDFAELTNAITGNHPAADFKVDLNTFSYYAYNFLDFQVQDYHSEIYFRLQGNDHAYLVVRQWDEIMDRTNWPEKYKD